MTNALLRHKISLSGCAWSCRMFYIKVTHNMCWRRLHMPLEWLLRIVSTCCGYVKHSTWSCAYTESNFVSQQCVYHILCRVLIFSYCHNIFWRASTRYLTTFRSGLEVWGHDFRALRALKKQKIHFFEVYHHFWIPNWTQLSEYEFLKITMVSRLRP